MERVRPQGTASGGFHGAEHIKALSTDSTEPRSCGYTGHDRQDDDKGKERRDSMNPKTLAPGCEQYEKYISSIRRKPLMQYDYRDVDGQLFSCVRPTLEQCIAKRDEWLAGKRKGLA